MSSSTGRTTSKTKYMALVGLMTAVICVIAPFSIVFPFSPIPVSLSTLTMYLCIMVLGGKKGFLCILLYILLGLCGLPVFSGFSGGAGKLLGPTGGYIIGYIFMAIICGIFTDKWPGRFLPCFIGMLLGTFTCYAFGTIWLSIQSHLNLSAAFASGVLPFLPADLIKILLATTGGKHIRKRLIKANLL